jgi:hypothetical protein
MRFRACRLTAAVLPDTFVAEHMSSIMAAPVPAPDPLAHINKSILSTLKVDLTPEGMQAFSILFPAAIGSMLSTTLQHAIDAKEFEPTERKMIALHEHVYNSLVLTLASHPAVLVQMTAECGKLGPKCIMWLNARYNPNTTTTGVLGLMNILKKPVDADDLKASIGATIAKNALLPAELKLTESAMVVLILLNLPESFSTLRQIVIERDTLPSLSELQAKVSNIMSFGNSQIGEMGSEKASFALAHTNNAYNANTRLTKPCFNCDTVGHNTAGCPKDKVDCKYCGVLAGHLLKYCFIANEALPLPDRMHENQRDAIHAKRKAIKARAVPQPAGPSAAMCFPTNDDSLAAVDEDFWAQLQRQVSMS